MDPPGGDPRSPTSPVRSASPSHMVEAEPGPLRRAPAGAGSRPGAGTWRSRPNSAGRLQEGPRDVWRVSQTPVSLEKPVGGTRRRNWLTLVRTKTRWSRSTKLPQPAAGNSQVLNSPGTRTRGVDHALQPRRPEPPLWRNAAKPSASPAKGPPDRNLPPSRKIKSLPGAQGLREAG